VWSKYGEWIHPPFRENSCCWFPSPGISIEPFHYLNVRRKQRSEERHVNRLQVKSSRVRSKKTDCSLGLISPFLFFCVCLCAPGIAGYKSLKVKIEPANSYAFHQQQGSITIAADPYETKEKIKTAFDLKELEQMGIVPVHIIISNDGEDPIVISGQDINLLDSNNRSFESMPVDEVVRAIVYKESPRTSRNPSPIPFPRGNGRRGDAFEIETDLTNKSLREVRVSPRTTFGGFVFFKLPNNRMKLGGYKVYIPEIRNVKTRQSLLFFEIDLK
jgi:hypothetical protein